MHNHPPNHPPGVMRTHPFETYNLRIKPNEGEEQMDKVLETILLWFQPVNASLFLVALGLFLWLLARAGEETLLHHPGRLPQAGVVERQQQRVVGMAPQDYRREAI